MRRITANPVLHPIFYQRLLHSFTKIYILTMNNPATTFVLAGIGGYAIVVDKNASTDPGYTITNGSLPASVNLAQGQGDYYIHVRTFDKNKNAGGVNSALTHTTWKTTLDLAPTVANVTATTANGTYTTGQTVDVTVQFSENVTVTGTPQLTLNVGGGYAVDMTSSATNKFGPA